ncbi:MAG: ABC transporter ATP-binding protein [Acidobacteriota bacterium]
MNEWALRLEGVEKNYRGFALQPLTLTLEHGGILGLIGPNGAGKSTLMRILLGLVRADAGRVEVLGLPMPDRQVEVKRDVGYMAEDLRLYDQASLAWHMRFVARVFPSWDDAYARGLLDRFDLEPDLGVKGMSHGQRIKAALLLVLARRPRLLVLDEPTTGLDPVVRHEVLAEIMDVLEDESRSVLFSSHNTQDVEQISDTIAFLDQGRLLDVKDRESFVDSWSRLRLEVSRPGQLPEIDGVIFDRPRGSVLIATTNCWDDELRQLLQAAGLTVRTAEPMTLEEIFLANVQLSRRGAAAFAAARTQLLSRGAA